MKEIIKNEKHEVLKKIQTKELTSEIVKKYLVRGNGKVSEQETEMFLQLCKYQQLNPFLNEAYLIKYSNDIPASLVVARDVFLKRAVNNPRYKGHTISISGKIPEMTATTDVYIEGYKVPISVTVDYIEYVQLKNGQPNKFWRSKPKTMLKKVSEAQALRKAFPESLSNLYTEEEIMDFSEQTNTKHSKPVVVMPEAIKEEEEKEDSQQKQQTILEPETITEQQLQNLLHLCEVNQISKAKLKLLLKKKYGIDDINLILQEWLVNIYEDINNY